MATLKRFVEKIEDVAEELRPLYIETEGGKGFRLDAEPDDGGELKRGLERARGERDTARSERDALKGQIDEIQEKLGDAKLDDVLAKAARADKGGKADPDVEARIEAAREEVRAQLTEKFGKELATVTGERDDLSATIQTTVVREAAVRALADHKGSTTLLTDHVTRNLRAVPDGNGGLVVRVFNDEGQERISAQSGNDGPMSVDEFVSGLRDSPDFAPAFNGSGASGSGASDNSNGGAGTATSKAALGTPAAKAAYIREHGAVAYNELPSGAD